MTSCIYSSSVDYSECNIPKKKSQTKISLFLHVPCHVSPVMCHMSRVNCHVSHVMCHMSCVTCHLTTTLCSLTCYESPRRFCDAAAVDLVEIQKNGFIVSILRNTLLDSVKKYTNSTNICTDRQTHRHPTETDLTFKENSASVVALTSKLMMQHCNIRPHWFSCKSIYKYLQEEDHPAKYHLLYDNSIV